MEMPKKKILYLITQAELGGAQVYVKNLCEGFSADFDIIVAFGEKDEQPWLKQALDQMGIKNIRLPHLLRRISLLNDFLALIEIYKLIKKEKPDIIHLNSSKISILGSLSANLANLSKVKGQKSKVIYTVHGWVFNEPQRNTNFYKRIERFTARWKDKLICVSQFDFDTAKKEKIAPLSKLVAIHNGIRPVDFLPKEKAASQLRITNYELRIGNINIVSIGNLYKTKGFEFLINAVRLLLDRGHDASCFVIGEGEERDELERWIRDLRLENHFFLLGNLGNQPAAPLLSAFNIYVNSSVKEGLTTTIIEAMQAVLPIVATRVGGNAEMIEDGVTGLLAEPADSKSLADKLEEIILHPARAEAFARLAQTKAKEDFSFEQMIGKTRVIYNEE